MTTTSPRVGVLMVDIETLGVGPNAVVTQIAWIGVDGSDPQERLVADEMYLPVQTQINLGRTIDFSTILWWMKQDDKARARFDMNIGDDIESLNAFLLSFQRKVEQFASQFDEIEVWAKGPHFDITIITSLMESCGIQTPWKYNQPRDLRTLMGLVGLNPKDIPQDDIVPHIALEDCRLQMRCYAEAMTRYAKR